MKSTVVIVLVLSGCSSDVRIDREADRAGDGSGGSSEAGGGGFGGDGSGGEGGADFRRVKAALLCPEGTHLVSVECDGKGVAFEQDDKPEAVACSIGLLGGSAELNLRAKCEAP